MVNAAATATLVDLAPGRVAVAFGTGFTGRRAMGYGAITWAFMDAYIRAYRDLLRGEVVEWEGARMQMLHPDGHAPARPVEVPILVGALGPKGNEVAHELGDGLYATLQVPDFLGEYSWVPYLLWGTVLDESEAADSDARPRGGRPGVGAGLPRRLRVRRSRRRARALPGGDAWMDVVESAPAGERHLAVHAGHCVELNEADEAAWAAGGHAMLRDATVSGTRDEVRRRLDELGEQGVTEVVFQPCGPDTRGELERFLEAASS